MVLLLLVFDVGVDEQRVRLGVNVLHHDLETIEGASFRPAHFVGEIHDKVLVHNAVTGGEERKNVLDEVLLVIVEVFPVLEVFCKVNLFSGPERSLFLLVHGPNVIMLNGEQHESVEVFLEHGLNVLLSQVDVYAVVLAVFYDHVVYPP